MKNKINNERIKTIVKSVDLKIPYEIENKINKKIYRQKNFIHGFNWTPVLLTLLLLVAGIFFSLENKESFNIRNEIKIEYELKGKNIKIIWVKKKDFSLRRIKQ